MSVRATVKLERQAARIESSTGDVTGEVRYPSERCAVEIRSRACRAAKRYNQIECRTGEKSERAFCPWTFAGIKDLLQTRPTDFEELREGESALI
jgi:hypothetical protein